MAVVADWVLLLVCTEPLSVGKRCSLGVLSVPMRSTVWSASGRNADLTIRGVMDSTSSDCALLSCWLPNKRPNIGKSPSPGTRAAELLSVLLISPPKNWVSPSCRRKVVPAKRVPIW